MNIITFKYTKSDGSVSDRVFIPLSKPHANYFGIDISELDIPDQVNLAEDIAELDRARTSALAEVMAKYDVKHSFRTFNPSKMTEIEAEDDH